METATLHPTPAEIDQARIWGRERRQASRSYHRNDVPRLNAYFIDTVGVLGEMMVCRYMNWKYEFRVNSFRAADIGDRLEVRTTTDRKNHCKVRPDDDDDFVVVMGIIETLESPVYLPGWITVAAGREFPLRDPHRLGRPFHFVPQSALRPMPELKPYLEAGVDLPF